MQSICNIQFVILKSFTILSFCEVPLGTTKWEPVIAMEVPLLHSEISHIGKRSSLLYFLWPESAFCHYSLVQSQQVSWWRVYTLKGRLRLSHASSRDLGERRHFSLFPWASCDSALGGPLWVQDLSVVWAVGERCDSYSEIMETSY